MSGLLAIVDLSGRPVDAALLDRMLGAQASRGTQVTSRSCDGAVALATCDHQLHAERTIGSRPPPTSTGVQVIFDGRLDNAEELAASLVHASDDGAARPTATLVALAYERWGAGCAAHFLGDFAFVLWDGRTRTLVAARDVLGLRPLYVHARADLLIVASEPAAVLAHPDVPARPNDGFVAECLAGQIVDDTDTVWADVQRLRPGHVLVAASGRTSIRRYWQPDPAAEIRYASDREYADHLADLLRRATRDRVRGSHRVGLMLSGGLDSSSLLGLLQTGDSPTPVRTYSLTTPGEHWDESDYLDHVTRRWPVPNRRIAPYVPTLDHFVAETRRFRDLPSYPTSAAAKSLFAAASADSVPVLLTGIWSDEWFTGSTCYYADLLKRLRLMALWRHHRAQSRDPDAFHPPSLFRAAVWPLVSHPVRERIKRMLGRTGIPSWIDASFAARVGLRDRLRPRPAAVRLSTLSKTETFDTAASGASVHTAEDEHRRAVAAGIDTRHPFSDRRILEFALAIPDEQRWRGGQTKFVLRGAARDWIPPAVARRVTFPHADSIVLRSIRDVFDGTPSRSFTIARRGWIDAQALDTTYRRVLARQAAGDPYDPAISPLWLVCAVELWAREQAA